MVPTGNLWDRTLVRLKKTVAPEVYSEWLRPTSYRNLGNGLLTVEVPNIRFQEWLQTNYMDQIVEAAGSENGSPVQIGFTVRSDSIADLSEAETATAASIQTPAIEAFETPLNSRYTFDNFVVGESNRFAHAAAMAVADPNSRAYNPLFIYGGTGVGKTHLMHGIGNQLKQANANMRVLYATSEQFFNSFIGCVQRSMHGSDASTSAFRSLYRNVDLLMIDDVQFFIGKEGTQTEFFHTFNALYDAGKKIVLTSDRHPMELATLEERLKSRFLWGLQVDIQQPDLETRVAILQKKTIMSGLDIPSDVILLIAERVQSNVRHLEGVLNRLSAHATLSHSRINMDLAKEVLVDLMVTPEGPKIPVEAVLDRVCDYFNLRLHELIGPSRQKKFATARHIAMYLCRKLTDLSLPDLAARFGGRNHSTVLHACRKIERDLATDTNLQNIVSYIERAVRESK